MGKVFFYWVCKNFFTENSKIMTENGIFYWIIIKKNHKIKKNIYKIKSNL